MYDWNMQFAGVDEKGENTGEKDHIKGDFEVDARGSSVLLVRELQAQNLMVMTANFTSHPVLGPMTKSASLYRKTIEAHMLSHADIVKTDDEIAEQARIDAETQGPDVEIQKLQMQMEIATVETNGKLQIADMNRQTSLMVLAEKNNMTIAQIQSALAIKSIEVDSKERMLAAEAAIEERKAASGDTKGSGGFLS